jgi:hypothetical protein
LKSSVNTGFFECGALSNIQGVTPRYNVSTLDLGASSRLRVLKKSVL